MRIWYLTKRSEEGSRRRIDPRYKRTVPGMALKGKSGVEILGVVSYTP